jgi:hypothetical protein
MFEKQFEKLLNMRHILLSILLTSMIAGVSAQNAVSYKTSSNKRDIVTNKTGKATRQIEKSLLLAYPYVNETNSKSDTQLHKLDSIVYSYNEDGVSVITEKDTYQYDENGNCIVFCMYNSDFYNNLFLAYKQLTTFSDGKVIQENSFYRENADADLEEDGKYIYSYSPEGLIDSISIYRYDTVSQTWNFTSWYSYKYNESNQLITTTLVFKNGLNEYVREEYTYAYNSDGLLEQRAYNYRTDPDETMKFSTLIKFSYENKLLISDTNYDRLDDGTLGEAYDKRSYTRNTNSTISYEVYETFTKGEWKNESKSEFSYNSVLTTENVILPYEISNNFWESRYFQFGPPLQKQYYSYFNNEWVQSSTVNYYYCNQETDINDLKNTGTLSVYPNPVTNILNLVSDNECGTNCRLIDMTGQTILSVSLSPGQKTIDVSAIKNGCYFLQINENKGVSRTVKIVKQ